MSNLSLFWLLPFASLLALIAMGPVLFPKFWERNYGFAAGFCALLVLLPMLITQDIALTGHEFMVVMVQEYLPFMILLSALFTICGGIVIRGDVAPSAFNNTAILLIGGILASIMGTTGASMVLIRPLIRINLGRKYQQHLIIFFIFIVANIGGVLTPLGDPPLFLGYLNGVDFFWTTTKLLPDFCFLILALLAIFYGLDYYFMKKDTDFRHNADKFKNIHLVGKINVFLLILLLIAVIFFGAIPSLGTLDLWGLDYQINDLFRNLFLLFLTIASWVLTPKTYHQENGFNFHPITEVAKLFFGIFICLIPIIAILSERERGSLSFLFAIIQDSNGNANPFAYYWLTGLLSSFLDNAPTYLVFFNAAGGNAGELMTTGAPILAAISAGAVFMGANSYIGNAPNLMVKSIAEHHHIKMPSFMGYCGWALVILVPLLAVNSWLFHS